MVGCLSYHPQPLMKIKYLKKTGDVGRWGKERKEWEIQKKKKKKKKYPFIRRGKKNVPCGTLLLEYRYYYYYQNKFDYNFIIVYICF